MENANLATNQSETDSAKWSLNANKFKIVVVLGNNFQLVINVVKIITSLMTLLISKMEELIEHSVFSQQQIMIQTVSFSKFQLQNVTLVKMDSPKIMMEYVKNLILLTVKVKEIYSKISHIQNFSFPIIENN